jgi:hypothetical protein
MAIEKLNGKTRIVATKITASPQGTPPIFRIAEVYFLQKSSAGGMRGYTWRTGNIGERRQDFIWWSSVDPVR